MKIAIFFALFAVACSTPLVKDIEALNSWLNITVEDEYVQYADGVVAEIVAAVNEDSLTDSEKAMLAEAGRRTSIWDECKDQMSDCGEWAYTYVNVRRGGDVGHCSNDCCNLYCNRTLSGPLVGTYKGFITVVTSEGPPGSDNDDIWATCDCRKSDCSNGLVEIAPVPWSTVAQWIATAFKDLMLYCICPKATSSGAKDLCKNVSSCIYATVSSGYTYVSGLDIKSAATKLVDAVSAAVSIAASCSEMHEKSGKIRGLSADSAALMKALINSGVEAIVDAVVKLGTRIAAASTGWGAVFLGISFAQATKECFQQIRIAFLHFWFLARTVRACKADTLNWGDVISPFINVGTCMATNLICK